MLYYLTLAIFNIMKYSGSYFYLEYFQKSNLVLGIFLAIPETKSKSHSQDSGFTLQYKTLPLQQPTLYWLPVCNSALKSCCNSVAVVRAINCAV